MPLTCTGINSIIIKNINDTDIIRKFERKFRSTSTKSYKVVGIKNYVQPI